MQACFAALKFACSRCDYAMSLIALLALPDSRQLTVELQCVRCRPSFSSDSPNATDCDGHGTHIGSTAVGRVVGVAKEASLVAVRVLDCTGSGQVLICHLTNKPELTLHAVCGTCQPNKLVGLTAAANPPCYL